jgi:phosphoribosylamine-glycine ligase
MSPSAGIPIRGIPDGTEENYYWYEVEVDHDDENQLVSSVGTGVVADIVGLGDSIEEAYQKPYEILDQLLIPNKQYRTDLDAVLSEQHEETVEQERLASVGDLVEVWE